jgi:hypothetical protein
MLDQPLLEIAHESAHVGAAQPEVQQNAGHPLPGHVIGELIAASGRKDGKAGLDQVGGLRARPRSVDRRMFQQPDELGRAMVHDAGFSTAPSFAAGAASVGRPIFAAKRGRLSAEARKGAGGPHPAKFGLASPPIPNITCP